MLATTAGSFGTLIGHSLAITIAEEASVPPLEAQPALVSAVALQVGKSHTMNLQHKSSVALRASDLKQAAKAELHVSRYQLATSVYWRHAARQRQPPTPTLGLCVLALSRTPNPTRLLY